jgi:AraC-like DNA-binding protein
MKYLFVISGVFAVLFFLFLITKKGRKAEHLFLATIVFFIAINSFYIFQVSESDGFYYKSYFSEFNYAIPLLYGALTWFYTRALTNVKFKFTKFDYLHYLPFVIFLIFLVYPLILGKGPVESRFAGFPLIKLIVMPFYLIGTLILLKNYRREFKNSYSYPIAVNLMWLTWVVTGAVVFWVLASTGYIYNYVTGQNQTLLWDSYVIGLCGIYLFITTYIAVTRTDLFRANSQDPVPTQIDLEPVIEPTIEKNITTEEVEESIDKDLIRLKEHMKNNKLYLDPLLSINKLSELTHIPQYKISKILNTNLNQSFYDFVNGYRVDEVKEKLKNGAANDLSILGIALDSGFNSKASFNRVFKNKEGVTPSAYLKTLG